jgi:hypothetical protein
MAAVLDRIKGQDVFLNDKGWPYAPKGVFTGREKEQRALYRFVQSTAKARERMLLNLELARQKNEDFALRLGAWLTEPFHSGKKP